MLEPKPFLLYTLIILLILLSLVFIIAHYVTGKYYQSHLTKYDMYQTNCIWHHPFKQTWYICLGLFNMGDIKLLEAINPFSILPLETYRRPIDTIITSVYMTLYYLLVGVSIIVIIPIIFAPIVSIAVRGFELWHLF